MPSGYKLVWSDNALNDLKNILFYLESNWSERAIKKFVKKLDFRLNLISPSQEEKYQTFCFDIRGNNLLSN
jgi:plasmid stabilization system protein ParE